jgi:chemotaxis response regulator CheB
LKTLVNREPRPAGAVVENWNGMDESGTTYVPDLPDFVVGIAASSLPENSIITYGNRTTTFSEWAAKRIGTPLFKHVGNDHRHHKGLTTLDDVAPQLEAKVQNATWSDLTQSWRTNKKALRIQLALRGPSATAFAKHPSKLVVYLDQRLVAEVARPAGGMSLELSTRDLSPGLHLVALNWASAYGPVSVETILVSLGGTDAVRAVSRDGGKR